MGGGTQRQELEDFRRILGEKEASDFDGTRDGNLKNYRSRRPGGLAIGMWGARTRGASICGALPGSEQGLRTAWYPT